MSTKEARFLETLEIHKGILFKICRLYQDRPDDQQDLFQEIIAQLWTSFDSFRGESKISSWMYSVAFNTAIVFFRKENRRRDVYEIQESHHIADELQVVSEKEEQLAIFHKAVQRLNRLEKALIFLYMEGNSGMEMGEILGLSPGNVRVKLSRVKEKLQYIIKTMGYEF